MKYSPRNLLRSELIRNTSVLITGTVAAQLISILLQPFLRRFFSAEAFGTFSVYMSIVGIVAVISTLRYDDAIVLPRTDKESVNVVALSLLFNISINLFLFVAILLWGNAIIRFLGLPSYFSASILCLIPLSVFLLNTYQSLNYWLIRKKRYYTVSANKLIRRGSEGASQVIFALLKNPKGLIFSDIIGQIANVVSITIRGLKTGLSFKLLSVNKIKYVFRKYSDFPKFNLIPVSMSTCSFYLPPLLINKFYSTEFTGYFDLSKLVLSIPVAFVASSISNVLLQKIAEKYNSKQSFIHELKPVFYIVVVICILELIVIYFFGIPLFKIVFGNNWQISGEISRIMVWSFAFSFFVSSFSCLFISMRRIKTYGIWQFFYFMAIMCLLFFKGLDYKEFLKIYVLIEVACYTAMTGLLIYIVSQYELSLKKLNS
ncbi:MAG: lipopolysaccharide biosynthesis protein [Bacteroidales bacterium]